MEGDPEGLPRDAWEGEVEGAPMGVPPETWRRSSSKGGKCRGGRTQRSFEDGVGGWTGGGMGDGGRGGSL